MIEKNLMNPAGQPALPGSGCPQTQQARSGSPANFREEMQPLLFANADTTGSEGLLTIHAGQ
jgi:hypothetical protein